jgi:hypothetical protein
MLDTQFSGNGDLGIEVIYSDDAEVALRGELDIAAAPALREQLSEVVTQGWIDIAIDIAEVAVHRLARPLGAHHDPKSRRGKGRLISGAASDQGGVEALRYRRT